MFGFTLKCSGGFHWSNVTDIRKYIFVCLFSVHSIISLSHHEQMCSISLRLVRYLSHQRLDNGRIFPGNAASLNTFVHDMLNLFKIRQNQPKRNKLV